MNLPLSRRLGNGLGFMACVALIGYALYCEHVLGLDPCPLCIFQRVAVIAIGVLFLIAALHNPGRTGARVYGALIGVASLGGIGIAGRHIWIQAQPAGSVAACGADLSYLADIMPLTELVAKVLTGSGECAEVVWTLFGLSMPWWVAFSIAALLVWGVFINIAQPSRSREIR